MLKHFLLVALMASFHSVFSQDANSWSTYFENGQLRISVKKSDCDYPEKGINNRYLFLKLENLTDNAVSVSYDLNRSYNGKEITPDRNGFEFNIPANGLIEATCDHLTNGLHIYVKILSVEAKSSLTGFEVSDLVINGKTIEQ